jgi:hypothetical protein
VPFAVVYDHARAHLVGLHATVGEAALMSGRPERGLCLNRIVECNPTADQSAHYRFNQRTGRFELNLTVIPRILGAAAAG